MKLVLIVGLFYHSSRHAVAQDMRGEAVSCGDLLRKCEIDCMLPTPQTSVDYSWPQMHPMPYEKISSCTDGCALDFGTCSETDTQKAALSCTYECSTTYEAGMLACLQELDGTTTNTVDDTMDDCANDATLNMNVCVETCHDSDVYGGWTEATEEGIDVNDVEAIEQFSQQPGTTKVPNYRAGIPSYKKKGKVTLGDVLFVAEGGSGSASSGASEWGEKLGVGGTMGLSGLFAGTILVVGVFAKRALGPSLRDAHEPL